ncbi:DMT family transporter [Shinella sp.]|uniref:DMT family transporter n=1 Tax=Shinella sp. TaxID=1870904 RepID=UPI003F6EBE23
MTVDRPLLGNLLMMAFCVVAPMGDALAKLAGAAVPLLMLATVRFGIQAVILLPLILATGGRLSMSPRLLRMTLLRTVLHIAGITGMYTSLYYLPLADAVAIAFVMPFIMLLLGHFVLGEEVGSRRLAACTVGFIGTLMVVQPSFAEVGLPALLPLFVAVSFSFYMLVSRQIAKDRDPMVLQTVSGLMGTPILALMTLATLGLEGPLFGVVVPDAAGMVLLLAIGILGTIGHLLMTWSLRFAPSATVAPIQYLEIPVATLIGWLVFADLPNGVAALGIAITMAAGLYILVRERRLAQPIPSQA